MKINDLIRLGGPVAILAGVMLAAGALTRYFGLSTLGISLIFFGLPVTIFALTALYAAQAATAGRTGFLGYVLTVIGQIFVGPVAFLWLASFAGVGEAAHTVLMFSWGVVPILHLAVLLTVIGGILFGVATIRAGVFPRAAGLAIVVGEVLNLLTEYVPALLLLYPIAALLVGGAIAWLGWSLWSGERVARVSTSRAAA